MDGVTDLAKYGTTGVSIATLVALVLIIRDFFKQSEAVGRRHEATYVALSRAIERNTRATEEGTKASQEVTQFMRNLNGKLVQATNSKLK